MKLKRRLLWLIYLGPKYTKRDVVSLLPKYQQLPKIQSEVDSIFGKDKKGTGIITSVALKEDDWYYGFDDEGQEKFFPSEWFDTGFNIRGCAGSIATLLIVPILVAFFTVLFSNPNAFRANTPTPIAPTPDLLYTSFTQIWDGDKTLIAERDARYILVATPDLNYDFGDPVWSERIYDNMVAGGVRYYYIFPSTSNNRAKQTAIIERLENTSGVNPENIIRFVGIPATEFPWYGEYVYYDPYYSSEGHALVIDNLVDTTRSLLLNIELPPDWALLFKEDFEEIWNSEIDDQEWKLPPPSPS